MWGVMLMWFMHCVSDVCGVCDVVCKCVVVVCVCDVC